MKLITDNVSIFLIFNILEIDCFQLYKVIVILDKFFLNYEEGELKLIVSEKAALKNPSLVRVHTIL